MHNMLVVNPDTLEGPDAASLQSVLCYLMTHYTLRPCPRLAHSIVEHLRKYLAHPEVVCMPGRCSTYRNLLRQWEGIAVHQMSDYSPSSAQSKSWH
jgi:hypothetical protein